MLEGVGKQFETVMFALSGTKTKIPLNISEDPIFLLGSRNLKPIDHKAMGSKG